MDNFIPNDEYLIRYLDGELTADESNILQQHLAADALLQEQYNSLLLAKESLHQYGLRRQVAAIHPLMMADLKQPVKQIGFSKRIVRMSMTAAAAAILLIIGYWLLSPGSVTAEKIFAANFQSYELTTARGMDTETELSKAYRDKQYTTVLQLEKNLPVKSVQSSFLAGMAAMEMKDDRIAITYLSQVLKANETAGREEYNDEAEYYLALSYIRNGQYTTALSLLQKIGKDPAHIYHQQVTNKLVSQVEKLNN